MWFIYEILKLNFFLLACTKLKCFNFSLISSLAAKNWRISLVRTRDMMFIINITGRIRKLTEFSELLVKNTSVREGERAGLVTGQRMVFEL